MPPALTSSFFPPERRTAAKARSRGSTHRRDWRWHMALEVGTVGMDRGRRRRSARAPRTAGAAERKIRVASPDRRATSRRSESHTRPRETQYFRSESGGGHSPDPRIPLRSENCRLLAVRRQRRRYVRPSQSRWVRSGTDRSGSESRRRSDCETHRNRAVRSTCVRYVTAAKSK